MILINFGLWHLNNYYKRNRTGKLQSEAERQKSETNPPIKFGGGKIITEFCS